MLWFSHYRGQISQHSLIKSSDVLLSTWLYPGVEVKSGCMICFCLRRSDSSIICCHQMIIKQWSKLYEFQSPSLYQFIIFIYMFDIEFINVSFKYIDSIKRISRNDYFTINDFFFSWIICISFLLRLLNPILRALYKQNRVRFQEIGPIVYQT